MTSLPDPKSVKKIAVRLTNWVGDCVMNTPFLHRLREIFPNAGIVAVGRKNVAMILKPHPDVDEVWAIDDSTPAHFAQSVARVRRIKADIGFILPNSIKTAALFAAAGIPHRIGYNRDARRVLLNHPVTLRPEDLAVHEVRYYLRLLHFWEGDAKDPPPLRLMLTDEERAQGEHWLQSHGVEPGQMVVGLNPAAIYGTAKRWLPERFAEVGAHFMRAHGARVVVTGLQQEHDIAQQVCDAGDATFINAAGKMKLRDLMAFIERCNLFVTNDSGAMHVAAAFGTNLIAVFGSTDWVTTAPLSSRARIVRVETVCAPCILRHCPIDHRCMTGVTAQRVIDEAEDLIGCTATARQL
ncbi:lipopolysaccharide heptosyltransferase II [Candidatus Sumerlaeota bacterium]|nr:lipopolysaccharide heptosyltransferase II [Candidatus Sumerlaeota bacterium]